MRTWMLFVLSMLAFLGLMACSRPEPPTLTPERVEVVDSDAVSFIARVHCKAHNPNGFAIPVKSVRGNVRFEQSDTSGVTGASTSTLAPNADTDVVLDLKADWPTVATTVGHAHAGQLVNYTASGTATLDASGKDIELPFSMQGQVQKTVIVLAVFHHVGLPKTLPSGMEAKLRAARAAGSASVSTPPAALTSSE
jgi:LEA14-like dessication related protein